MLLEAEEPVVARAWFAGANTHLDRESPATMLRDATSPDDVMQVIRAAGAFVL